MIITFCGHSSYSGNMQDEEKILTLLEEISNGEDLTFYLGGYGGFDGFAKQCCKKYKILHPNSRIIFITPYLGKWLDERKEYIEEEYDEVIYPELENVPPKFAISRRNEWMVNQADYVIAYVQLHFGGAYNTLLYAHKHNKLYTNIYKGNYELY